MVFRRKPDPEYCGYLADMISIIKIARQCIANADGIWYSPQGLSREEAIKIIDYYLQGFLNEFHKEKCEKIISLEDERSHLN